MQVFYFKCDGIGHIVDMDVRDIEHFWHGEMSPKGAPTTHNKTRLVVKLDSHKSDVPQNVGGHINHALRSRVLFNYIIS